MIFRPWWHHDCTFAALNGEYGQTTRAASGMYWLVQQETGRNKAMVNTYVKPRISLMKFRILKH